MKITILISFIIVQSFVSTDDNKPVVRSLCFNPWITAADRLPNNTIRVYRDDYYWELTGLPGKSGQSKGPYKVWYQYMAPIEKGSSVQTVLSGKTEGLTYKLRGNRYWVYDSSNGELKLGGKAGFKSNALTDSGCKAVLNDGGMAGKGSALMICFDGSKVRYYNMRDQVFKKYGRVVENGAYGEKFPSDITAAFAYPADDKAKAKFNVYLFKAKKYCYRPYIGEDGCKEWRDNTELFGCNEETATVAKPVEPEPELKPKPKPKPKPQEEAKDTEKKKNGCNGFDWIGTALILEFLLNIMLML